MLSECVTFNNVRRHFMFKINVGMNFPGDYFKANVCGYKPLWVYKFYLHYQGNFWSISFFSKCMMYDVWCMMYDVWWMMYDVWCRMYGVWCMMYDVGCVMYDVMYYWFKHWSIYQATEIVHILLFLYVWADPTGMISCTFMRNYIYKETLIIR